VPIERVRETCCSPLRKTLKETLSSATLGLATNTRTVTVAAVESLAPNCTSTSMSSSVGAGAASSRYARPAMPVVANAGPQSQPKSEPALRTNDRRDGSAHTL